MNAHKSNYNSHASRYSILIAPHVVSTMEVGYFFNLLKEAECSFCIQTVKKPKSLPCLHSFCHDCLENCVANKRQQGETTFNCPVCLATFQLPDGDRFSSFPSSLYLNRLIDILGLENTNTKQQRCGSCEERGSVSFFCFGCKNFLCPGCLEVHDNLDGTRSHRRASLQNLQEKDVRELIGRPLLCEKQDHEKEQLEYYCRDCQVCICYKCSQHGHNQHAKLDIKYAASQQEMHITQVVEKVKYQIAENKEVMEEERKNFEIFEQRIKSTKEVVHNTTEELIQVLKEHKASIISELEGMRKAQEEVYFAQQKTFELTLAQMNSSIECIEAILKRNIGPEILQAETAIRQRCEEFVTGEKMKASKPIAVGFVTNKEMHRIMRESGPVRIVVSLTDASRSVAEGKVLEEGKCEEIAQFKIITKDSEGQVCYWEIDQVTVHIKAATEEEIVAELEDNKDGTYIVTFVPKGHGQCVVTIRINGQELAESPWGVRVTQRQQQVVTSFGSNGIGTGQFDIPRGVAVSDTGNIAVADHNNNRVQVFTSEGVFLWQFGQKGREDERVYFPVSLAYTSPDHIIVIHGLPGLKRATLFTDKGRFIKHFSPDHINSAWGISVTDYSQVIVCDVQDKDVKVLSLDGETLSLSFKAPDCGGLPYHAVYDKGKFFVSYRGAHCIKVFDDAGEYRYDIGSEGSGDGQFQSPCGIAIDKNGNVIVVDGGNDRVQIFTPEGEFVSKIGEHGTELGQFHDPDDVAVGKDGEVFVCDYENNRIQILR